MMREFDKSRSYVMWSHQFEAAGQLLGIILPCSGVLKKRGTTDHTVRTPAFWKEKVV